MERKKVNQQHYHSWYNAEGYGVVKKEQIISCESKKGWERTQKIVTIKKKKLKIECLKWRRWGWLRKKKR